jgi:NADH:ubiquinone oxidoreductase subunit 4 (subunit M)
MGPFNARWVGLADMRARELTAAAPLAVLIVVLGLFPTLALELTSPTINRMVTPF